MFSNSHINLRVHILLLFLIAAFSGTLKAQPGGKAFQFLEIANSARVTALGGDIAALEGNNPDLVYHNPALLNSDMHHHMVINYVNYFAGANFGFASAALRLNAKSMLAGGIHYLYYGTFQGADENGIKTGDFRAADYSLNITYSRVIDSLWTIGITAKNIYSDYELYNSTAIAVDAGITYSNPETRFTAGLVIRNAGMQVDAYTVSDSKEPLPFNIAIGVSKGLRYAPFTFNITLNHLEKWDLTYKTQLDTEEEELNLVTGEKVSEGKFDTFIDRFMRHVAVGTTVSLGKNLEFRLGYNYRRRQELKVDTRPAMVGFSWGIGLNLNKFSLGYGRGIYHLAGATNHFSFSMNLDEFSKKF